MSIHIERFAFDRVFVAPQREDKKMPVSDLLVELAALRQELAVLKADTAAAIAQARAEGFEQGLAQARAERETALLSAVDALQAGVEALDERFDVVATQVTSDASEVALAAAELLAARAIEGAPVAAIDDAIGRALEQVARGTEITVRVNPDLVEAIEARIAERQSADRRRLRLTVVGDVTLPIGDARLVWEEGGLALDAGARRAAIVEELRPLLALAA